MNPKQFDEKRRHAQLRKAAEAQLASAPPPEPPDRPSEELLHELRVHQVELEMQNEELRRAHAALEESRDRYVDLYEFAPVGYLTLSREGMIAEINLTGATLLGMERKKLLRSRFDALVAPEDRDRWYHQFAGMVKHELGRQKFELELTRGDGSVFYGRLDCLRVEGAAAPPLIRIALTNIDDVKRGKIILRESEEKFRAIFEGSLDGVLLADIETKRFAIGNPAICRMLGYSHEELTRLSIPDIHPQQDLPYVIEKLEKQLRGEARLATDMPIKRQDGSVFYADINTSSPVNFGGKNHVLGVFRDITERRQAEDALRKSRDLLYSIVENAPVRIFWKDRDLHYLGCNTLFAKDAGRSSPGELRGQTDFDMGWKDQAELYSADDKAVMESGQPKLSFEEPQTTPEGATIWLSTSKVPLRDEHDQVIGVLGIYNDITARKQAEEALHLLNETLEQRVREEVEKNREKDLLLVQQSRLAAIGEVIHNVAHHWRQPLSAVSLVLANLKDTYEFGELDRAYLDQEVALGQQLIQGMSATIDRFRSFFTADGEKQSFRVCDEVDEAVGLLGPAFKSANIEIEFEHCREAHSISGYPGDFARVVLSVLTNARDAIVKKNGTGKIHIAAEQRGKMATVSISDNGGGIPAEALSKIFDPYFTTHESGTGLGLYLAKTIMDHMGGTIAIRNRGDGAEVLLALPLEENEQVIPRPYS